MAEQGFKAKSVGGWVWRPALDAHRPPPTPHHAHTGPGLPPTPQEDRTRCQAAPDGEAEVEFGAGPPGRPAPVPPGAPTSRRPGWAPGKHGRHLVAAGRQRHHCPSRAQPRSGRAPAARSAKLCRAGLCQADDLCPRSSLSFLPSFLRGWGRARKPSRACAWAAAGLLDGGGKLILL